MTLFESLAEEVCGFRASRFGSVDEFQEAIKKRLRQKRVGMARLDSLTNELMNKYVSHSRACFAGGKRLGGLKLVLGGSQRLPAAGIDAIRSMLLYADTILIPDPVLPWLEVERREEQFSLVWLFRHIYSVLQLKPLVDSDLPYPAVLVFPSWEKSLEVSDEDTQDALSRLFLGFSPHHLGTRFEDESEILDFATRREEEFLREVERQDLFIPPGGRAGMPVSKVIEAYREDIAKHRSKFLREKMLDLSPGVLLVNGIMERLIPQFHLRDNADMLRAEPMLWHETFWHYFGLCSSVSEGRLTADGTIRADTLSVLRALNSRDFRWLGNIPMDALVELRQRNENEEFRRKLTEFTPALGDSSFDNMERVIAEVGRGLASLLATHQDEIRRIEEAYKRRHAVTAIGTWLTLAAQFLPWLTPYLGPLFPAVAPGKYVYDKIAEAQERSEASRTLTGVLAAAHATG